MKLARQLDIALGGARRDAFARLLDTELHISRRNVDELDSLLESLIEDTERVWVDPQWMILPERLEEVRSQFPSQINRVVRNGQTMDSLGNLFGPIVSIRQLAQYAKEIDQRIERMPITSAPHPSKIIERRAPKTIKRPAPGRRLPSPDAPLSMLIDFARANPLFDMRVKEGDAFRARLKFLWEKTNADIMADKPMVLPQAELRLSMGYAVTIAPHIGMSKDKLETYLRALMDEFHNPRQLPSPLAEFAARWCAYERAPVTESDITEFENSLEAQMPDDYRQAICEADALWAITPPLPGQPDVLQVFGPDQIVNSMEEDLAGRGLPLSYIPIACDGSDLYAFDRADLVGSRCRSAPVHRLDLYVPMHEDPENWPYKGDAQQVAPSFNEWISNVLDGR